MKSLLAVAAIGIVIALTGVADGQTPMSGTGGIRFDPTITLGHILSALAMIAVVVGGYMRLKMDITEIRTKVDAMWAKWVRDE